MIGTPYSHPQARRNPQALFFMDHTGTYAKCPQGHLCIIHEQDPTFCRFDFIGEVETLASLAGKCGY
jgi:hypothetical protein